MSKIWLVTGSAHGLGRSIAEAALAHGDRVVATARNTRDLAPLVARFGEQLMLATLDVTDPEAAARTVQAAHERFGRLDVLVNNAGFGHAVAFEQTTEAGFRAQIDTNFYGVVNLSRAVLPLMRRQRAGHIVQISSVGGRIGMPGFTAYHAAKWAVGGFSESLQQEVASLGIRVTVIEPGGMRTGWVQRAGRDLPVVDADYQDSVGGLVDMLAQYAGQENSDPAKVAQIVLQLASHPNPPLRLMLGSDALQYAQPVAAARNAADQRWEAVTRSSDFAAPALADFPSN
ncbi:MAG: Short-chain dehydrogenase/reductase [Rhodoferax sp.]|nr:Short-chain dehydrogenase/reductase [Rhodoferax sp.]